MPDFQLPNLTQLPDLVTPTVETARPLLERYGLWVVGAGLFGETFFFSGAVVPGFAILLSVGYFIASGWLPPVPAVLTAVLGAVLGDIASYWLGYYWGHRLFRRKRELVGRLRLALEKEGVWLLLWYHYAATVRSVLASVAGTTRYDPRRFLIYDTAGVFLWSLAVIGLGYGAHSAFHARSNLALHGLSGAALLLMVVMTWRIGRRLVRYKPQESEPQGSSG